MKSLTMKLGLAAALLISVAATSTAAVAEESTFGSLSGSVAVTTDYRFRGISQNDKNPAPQAGLTWETPLWGLYVGTWASKTNWSSVAVSPTDAATPTFELDVFAGRHFDIHGTDLNVQVIYYGYPDANHAILGPKDASFFEVMGQLSRSFGDVGMTLTGAFSPEWSLGGDAGGYVAGTFSYPVTDWLSVSTTVGHQFVEAAISDYTHWDFGATATYKNWSLDLRFVGNDIRQADASFWMADPKNVKDGFVATVSYSISAML